MTLSGRCVVAFLIIALITGLVACGASTAPISVGLSPSSSKAIDQAQTVSITATVAHDSKNAGVTWSVTGGGTLTNQSVSGATYNAPSSVTTTFTATVTATSISDTTKSASLTITVNPLPTITTQSVQQATAGTNEPGNDQRQRRQQSFYLEHFFRDTSSRNHDGIEHDEFGGIRACQPVLAAARLPSRSWTPREFQQARR